LLINEGGNRKPSIEVHLVGDGKTVNRVAIGAMVEVRTGDFKQREELRSGTSYGSQNDLNLHFGLGQATKVDELVVRWPAKELPETRVRDLPAGRRYTIEQGKGVTKVEAFAR
jgi:hypothetical protein